MFVARDGREKLTSSLVRFQTAPMNDSNRVSSRSILVVQSTRAMARLNETIRQNSKDKNIVLVCPYSWLLFS